MPRLRTAHHVHVCAHATPPAAAQTGNGDFLPDKLKLQWSRTGVGIEGMLVKIKQGFQKPDFRSLKQPSDGDTYT